MKRLLRRIARNRTLLASCLAAFLFMSVASLAQEPAPRITTEILNSERVIVPGTHPRLARTENDIGAVLLETNLQGISIVFGRSAAQEAELQGLIAAQQNPDSPLYRKWLTPDEFAARFGVSAADIAKVESWLERQGFSVDGVSRSKNRITFSGSAGQLKAAFGSELRYYSVNGNTYYAPAADITVPAALSSVVQTVTNVSSFRPKPHVIFAPPQLAGRPDFTSGQTGNHFLTPKDVATIYDINRAYNAGYTGSGQSMAVVGQSSIALSDIENFQRAAGLIVKDPTLVFVPFSGDATFVSSGDEAESDLDLEYSGGTATGATIYFVYVGSANYSAFDALQYAVDTRIAPIISISYGTCETALNASYYSTFNGILEQAAVQGQSVIAASGDQGSTDCYGESGLTVAQQEALAVDFPASSQYVTAMGGTEFPAADVASSNTTYWQSAHGSEVVSSALSYIPEEVWNDDSSSNGIASGGGGGSTFTDRPRWQTSVTGITSGSYRVVPDISLAASPHNPGYLFCSSDSTSTGIVGSCSNGFRDANDQYLTVAGGTSFSTPIFAGMLAIINEKLNSVGQGVINSTLYTLAAQSATYASVFHDITSSGNQCTAGPNYCTSAGASEYPATTGYDEASGLGSVDFFNLLMAWPSSSSSLVSSRTALSAQTNSPAPSANDTITINVTPGSSSSTTTPTGALTVSVDGFAQTSSLALLNGSASFVFSSSVLGSHVITATYSGDQTYAPSDGTLTLTVTANARFTLVAANVTVSAGQTATSTVTVTPKNGYTGTTGFVISSSPSLSKSCFSLPDVTVSGASPVTAIMTIRTNSSACTSASAAEPGGFLATAPRPHGNEAQSLPAWNKTQASLSWAALLLFGLLGFGFYRRRSIAGVFLVIVFVALGCSKPDSPSPSPSSSGSNVAKGTYAVTIVGADVSSPLMTASTSMTLTID